MVYPDQISKVLESVCHSGFRGGNCVGTEPNLGCGTFVRFRLDIAEPDMLIREAGFETNGCGYMTAVSELLADYLAGKHLSDLNGLAPSTLNEVLEMRVGRIPDDRKECQTAVVQAVRAAFSDLRSRTIEEFRGEKALLCTCFGVTEDRIIAVIETGGIADVEGVTRACKAGGGCGSCQMLIHELVDSFRNRD